MRKLLIGFLAVLALIGAFAPVYAMPRIDPGIDWQCAIDSQNTVLRLLEARGMSCEFERCVRQVPDKATFDNLNPVAQQEVRFQVEALQQVVARQFVDDVPVPDLRTEMVQYRINQQSLVYRYKAIAAVTAVIEASRQTTPSVTVAPTVSTSTPAVGQVLPEVTPTVRPMAVPRERHVVTRNRAATSPRTAIRLPARTVVSRKAAPVSSVTGPITVKVRTETEVTTKGSRERDQELKNAQAALAERSQELVTLKAEVEKLKVDLGRQSTSTSSSWAERGLIYFLLLLVVLIFRKQSATLEENKTLAARNEMLAKEVAFLSAPK